MTRAWIKGPLKMTRVLDIGLDIVIPKDVFK
jgi:hypothetical protein